MSVACPIWLTLLPTAFFVTSPLPLLSCLTGKVDNEYIFWSYLADLPLEP